MQRQLLSLSLIFLLVVAFVSCGGGGGGGGVGNTPSNTSTQSLTEGSFTYTGTIPEVDNVLFTNRAGDTFVSDGAFAGLVELFVDPQANTGTVTAAIQKSGGIVVAQTPKIGLYVIKVSRGNENAFLNTMYSNSWVSEGGAVIQAVRGNATFDWNFGSNERCKKYHGSLVTDIANRRGNGFVMEPVSAHALVPQSLADLMLRRFEDVPVGQGQVISMSIGFDTLDGSKASQYTDDGQKWLAFEQYKFMRRFFAAAEQIYLTRPDLANRNMISIIAGNTGSALDSQLAALKTLFPNAFKRIVIVGAADASGAVVTQLNHLDDNSTGNMVYARGVDIAGSTPDGPASCSGTSYAAPEVASVLDYIWAHDPSLTSEQVISALRQALSNLNTNVIPQDTNGLTTTAFLNQVLAILGMPAQCTSYTYSAWSACQPNNTQTRTVTSSSPSGCVGTPNPSDLVQTCTPLPNAGTYAGTCTAQSNAVTCCTNGNCVTLPEPSPIQSPFNFTIPAGTSLSQFTADWCASSNAALIGSGCVASSCNNTASTSTSVTFTLSCTAPPTQGCTTSTVTEICSATQQ